MNHTTSLHTHHVLFVDSQILEAYELCEVQQRQLVRRGRVIVRLTVFLVHNHSVASREHRKTLKDLLMHLVGLIF